MPTKRDLSSELCASLLEQYESAPDLEVAVVSSVVRGVRSVPPCLFVRFVGSKKDEHDPVYVYFDVPAETVADMLEEAKRPDGSLNKFVRSRVSPGGAGCDYARIR